MPYFSEEWIQELLQKVNLVDLIGEYVTLQNKSGRWWACCPFHNEKTPSFSVTPEKGFFHCFGCGKGGNAIHFVMEQEKMTFPEACRYLADKVKLPVPDIKDDSNYEKRKQQREKIFAMNKITAQFFHKCLYEPQGKDALAYLHGRGLDDRIIKIFGMGYAPDKWDSLLNLLGKEGFTKQDMQLAGLVKINDGKCYDMFRNRVMMPIINTFSNVIGFGGRVMDDSLPKYLNSPETAAFNKSKNLYNLNMIRKQKNLKRLILVEGYMDVIAMHAYGIPECVATLGTALTQDQARLLKRYVNNVYVSYDGDGAGKKATLRALDILAREGIESRVVSIPGGQDPDEFLKQYGKDGYIKLMKASLPLMDYKFRVTAEQYDLNDSYQKEKFAKECVHLLKGVTSAMVREKYMKKLSELTGFSVNAIAQDAGAQQGQEISWKLPARETETESADLKTENCLIRLLATNPQTALKLDGKLDEGDFRHPANKKIFSYTLLCAKKGFSPTNAEILSVLQSEEDLRHATELFSMPEEVLGELKNFDDFFDDCVHRIQLGRLEADLKIANVKYESETDPEEKKALVTKISALTKEIHKLKTSF
ncbi:DNA primase [Christensenella timonensis]|uniref:DNA primase n=1 Tax=Christensenella timonensis TaxID=1816678 RepID=UPI00082E33E4|nr:DNA primase [Christensenella timonensis]